MGEEVFQLHVATPTYIYATHPDKAPLGLLSSQVRNRVFFPCGCATVSSFPAGAQQGILLLLVCNRVFFSCRYARGSAFPAGASELSYFLILPWQPNKTSSFREAVVPFCISNRHSLSYFRSRGHPVATVCFNSNCLTVWEKSKIGFLDDG